MRSALVATCASGLLAAACRAAAPLERVRARLLVVPARVDDRVRAMVRELIPDALGDASRGRLAITADLPRAWLLVARPER